MTKVKWPTGLPYVPEIKTNDFSNTTIQQLNINSTELTDNTLALWQAHSWFTVSYLDLVNPHWFSFPPPPGAAHFFLASLYVLIMLAGVFGNSLVIFMFIKCRSLRTPANILVTNLAISDLTMMMKLPMFIYNSIYQGIALGEIACTIYGFVGGLTGTVSICTLTAISIDRYYVVVYPLNRSSTTLRAKMSIAVAWIYGCIFASIPLLDLDVGNYVPEGYLTSCSFDYLTPNIRAKHFILCYFVAAWVVPFIIICFCYTKIIRVVLQARNIGNSMKDPSISSRNCKEQEQKKKEIRLALVVLIIIGLWFVAWTPYAVVALLGIAGQSQLITPLCSMIPALFCKTASCLDPFVYAVTNQRFKEELKVIFCKRRMDREKASKKVWSTNISKQATVRRDINSEEDVEEVMIMVDLPSKNRTVLENFEKKKALGRSTVQPVENISEEVNLSSAGKTNRASWVFRPTFSNSSSSLRTAARTWNRSKEHSIEAEEQITM
ncbi:Rhodopsin 7 [Carabus blaptoides fortunei]